MLRQTPFHSRTSALMQGHQWRRWAGYTVASAYEMSHDREYFAIRNACALIDVSPLCKYRITGADSLDFLNRLVTRDVSKCGIGSMLYTPWCDSQGKIIDDGTIAHLSENLYRLTSAEPNLRWLEENAAGMDVVIEDVSEEVAALSLQGPRSRDLLIALTDGPLAELKYYRFVDIRIRNIPVMISRTGYTGDLGYELWTDKHNAETLWDILVDAGRDFALQPAGIWALDVARIEAGLIMLDVDYTPANKAMSDVQRSTPLELGLQWAVSFKKSSFVGRQALLKEHQLGSSTVLVGLEIDHKEFERQHHALGLPVPYPFMAWRDVIPLYAGGDRISVADGRIGPGESVGHLFDIHDHKAALGSSVVDELQSDIRSSAGARVRDPVMHEVGNPLKHATCLNSEDSAISLDRASTEQTEERGSGQKESSMRQVGYATSGVWSPTLKKYIALAHLEPGYSQPGAVVNIQLNVDRFRRLFAARVTALPFFNPPRKKAVL